MSFIETYDVVGMTCDHCARAVTSEVSTVEGVTDVQVDVAAGRVRVTADQAVPVGMLRSAVEEAGYTLAP
jgi:copper chaperone CopZ